MPHPADPSTRSHDPLATTLAGISLRNPVLLAAGTAGTLDEMADVLPLDRIGGLLTKSLTAEPRDGNPTPRITWAQAGMLNAIGLANIGVDRFVSEHAPRAPDLPCTVIASVAGFSIDEYTRVVAALDPLPGIGGVELNVSCPNVHGGTEFGVDPVALADLVDAARQALPSKPLFVKLSPIAVGRPSIIEIARAAIEARGTPGGPHARPGADVLCLSNTLPAMAIDVHTRRPRLSVGGGGLSGPALHPVAVRLVHDVYRQIAREAGVPLVGIGGVLRWEDAAEFILAGASAVQMGTALFANPRSPLRVVRGLRRWVGRQGVGSIAELIGAATHENPG